MAITSNKQVKAFYADRLNNLASNVRTSAVCKHFGECGGCAMQHVDYGYQLQLKRQLMMETFDDEELPLEWEVVGSPDVYEYRVRMDYVVSHDPFHPPTDRVGLRKRKQFRHVIDLSECHLIPTAWFSKLRSVYTKAMELGIPAYDLVSGIGELRYLVIRLFAQNAMLSIVTKTRINQELVGKLAEFAQELGFSSIHWLLQPEVSDVSFGENIQYWGKQYLQVEMRAGERKIILESGPNNFFQNNIPGFSLILDDVINYLDHKSLSTLADLYCGVGTLGLALAPSFKSVVGVEISPENVALAKHNAEINSVGNISFFTADARQESALAIVEADTELTLVVDPPRAGLEPAGVELVKRLSPKTLIYISCNPVTQAADLKALREDYKVMFNKSYDLFPHTFHLESLLILERRS